MTEGSADGARLRALIEECSDDRASASWQVNARDALDSLLAGSSVATQDQEAHRVFGCDGLGPNGACSYCGEGATRAKETDHEGIDRRPDGRAGIRCAAGVDVGSVNSWEALARERLRIMERLQAKLDRFEGQPPVPVSPPSVEPSLGSLRALNLLLDEMIQFGARQDVAAPEASNAVLHFADKLEAVLSAAPPQDGASLIAAERQRQVTAEGWTYGHDDNHTEGELRDAAIAYAMVCDPRAGENARDICPWPSWWKPSDNQIRNLVKAGALIAAEIDRLQRMLAASLSQKDEPK